MKALVVVINFLVQIPQPLTFSVVHVFALFQDLLSQTLEVIACDPTDSGPGQDESERRFRIAVVSLMRQKKNLLLDSGE